LRFLGLSAFGRVADLGGCLEMPFLAKWATNRLSPIPENPYHRHLGKSEGFSQRVTC